MPMRTLSPQGQRTHAGLVRNVQRWFLRQREQLVQIDLFRDGIADLFDLGRGDMRLVAGHQAEMTLDDAEPLVVMDRTDYRHIGVMLDDAARNLASWRLPPRLLRMTPAILMSRSNA